MNGHVKGKPRIALSTLTFEGNSFSNVSTGLAQFERTYLLEGSAILEALSGTRDAVAGAIVALEDAEIVPLFAANAGSGGRVTNDAYASIKQRILRSLSKAGPVDGVYLALHGAMITDDLDDAEADLIGAVRDIVGSDTPIAVSCDLHGNITNAMVTSCDILLGFKLYPHDDAFETGHRACSLLMDTVLGRIHPVTSLKKLAALFPVPAQLTPDPYPMSIIRRAAEAAEERPGVLAVSYFPVHPWLDVPDIGFAAVVVTDQNKVQGDEIAAAVCRQTWDLRHSITVPIIRPSDAISSAPRTAGLVLLADVADCVGGGAPGTSAEVIEALLRHAPTAKSIAIIAAPEAVAAAFSSGESSKVTVDLGEEGYGPVVRVTAFVERLTDGHFTYASGPLGGVAGSLGRIALLRIGKLHVIATTHPAYEYGDEQFAAAGLDVQDYDFAVVKNPVNARLAIPHAEFIVLDTIGPTTPRLATLPWQRVSRPCFPMEDSPEPFWRPAA